MANFGLEHLRLVEPARRLAEREGAHRRLRRQLHRRRRAGLSDVRGRARPGSTGCAPPPRASATSPSRCSHPSRRWRRCGGGSAEGQRCGILFGPERNGLETERDRQRRRGGDGARQPQLRLPQSGPGRAAAELRVDEAGRRRHARPGHDLRGSRCSRVCGRAARRRQTREELLGASSSISSGSSTTTASSRRRKSAPAWCKTCAPCSPAWARRSRKSAPCGESSRRWCIREATLGETALVMPPFPPSDALQIHRHDQREWDQERFGLGRA